jgi:hypothetical protein
MNGQEHWQWLSRCRETARQLRDIGEETAADDIDLLIRKYIEEPGGGPS